MNMPNAIKTMVMRVTFLVVVPPSSAGPLDPLCPTVELAGGAGVLGLRCGLAERSRALIPPGSVGNLLHAPAEQAAGVVLGLAHDCCSPWVGVRMDKWLETGARRGLALISNHFQ
jgi:hypothetical protein